MEVGVQVAVLLTQLITLVFDGLGTLVGDRYLGSHAGKRCLNLAERLLQGSHLTSTLSTLAAFLSEVFVVLIPDDDDRAVILLATLEAGADIRELVLEISDAFILGGDLPLRLVESQVAIRDTALGLFDTEELRLDIDTQSLDGRDVLVALAFDEADGLFGLSQLSLRALVEVGDREEFLREKHTRLANFGP